MTIPALILIEPITNKKLPNLRYKALLLGKPKGKNAHRIISKYSGTRTPEQAKDSFQRMYPTSNVEIVVDHASPKSAADFFEPDTINPSQIPVDTSKLL